MHLRLDLLFKDNLPILKDLLDVRTQLARVRIDDGELLFNAESKRVFLRAHGRDQMSAKTETLSSRVLEGTPLASVGSEPLSYRFAVACRSYASLPKQRFVIVANVPGANF